MICTPFPTPPEAVHHALIILQITADHDAPPLGVLDDPGDLPRPWLPATCPPALRRDLWAWCDTVVTWINHDYAWRPITMIPSCWPHHPHLAQELPALACLRFLAEQSLTPDLLEEWHRYTLPTFLDRTASRLGESTCRTGRHLDWPAAARHDAHLNDHSTRHAAFTADTTTSTSSQEGPTS